MPPEKVEHFGENTPLGRAGQPAELAPAYVLLASPDGSYISGAMVPVTGGPMLCARPVATLACGLIRSSKDVGFYCRSAKAGSRITAAALGLWIRAFAGMTTKR